MNQNWSKLNFHFPCGPRRAETFQASWNQGVPCPRSPRSVPQLQPCGRCPDGPRREASTWSCPARLSAHTASRSEPGVLHAQRKLPRSRKSRCGARRSDERSRLPREGAVYTAKSNGVGDVLVYTRSLHIRPHHSTLPGEPQCHHPAPLSGRGDTSSITRHTKIATT